MLKLSNKNITINTFESKLVRDIVEYVSTVANTKYDAYAMINEICGRATDEIKNIIGWININNVDE